MTKKINNLFLSWKQTREKSVGKQRFMNHRLWQHELAFHADAMTPVLYTVWFSGLCMCTLLCAMHWKKQSSVSAHCTLSISVLFDVAAMRKFSIVGRFTDGIVGNRHPNISTFVLTWFLLQIVSTGTCMEVLIVQLCFLDVKEYLLVTSGYFITFIQKPWGPSETFCVCCRDVFSFFKSDKQKHFSCVYDLTPGGGEKVPYIFVFEIYIFQKIFGFRQMFLFELLKKINRLCCTLFSAKKKNTFFFLLKLLLFFLD